MNKTILLLSCLLVSFTFPTFADSKRTANYFRGLSPEYIGKEITIDVAAVTPLHKVESEKFGFLLARTYDTRSHSDGGKILVISDKEEMLGMVKKFGSAPDVDKSRKAARDVNTHRLTGTLRQTEKKVLFLDVAETEIPAEELKKVKEELVKTLKPGKKPAKGKAKKGKK